MDIGTLLIILVFLAPLLEKILTGGKKPPGAPPQQKPRQPPRPAGRQPAPYEVPQSSGPVRPEPDAGNASEMLPDDLWELVTGEKRKPRVEPMQERPQPLPARPAPLPLPSGRMQNTSRRQERQKFEGRPKRLPEPPRNLPEPTRSYDDDALDQSLAETRAREMSYDATLPPSAPPARYIPVHAPPVIISLEDNIPTDEQRHTAFHDKLAKLPPAARSRRDAAPYAAFIHDEVAMRNAFVMAEVLGKPKGLE